MNSSSFSSFENIQCVCAVPPLNFLNYTDCYLGMDKNEGRYGTVTLRKCIHCSRKWILYSMEDEAFSNSGRWYTGIVSEKDISNINVDNAYLYIKELPWYLYGGSYYGGSGVISRN